MAMHEMRKDYTMAGLHESDLDPDPIAQFHIWFADAQLAKGSEPNAMTLATADASGNPSARTVLLKEVDERGFVFYSNYESHKGQQLAENPRAELLFFWQEMERQVRIHGTVSRTDVSESGAYFDSRPLGNQLGATVSPQSQVIPNREFLEQKFAELEAQYASDPVPMPAYWGGYRVVPETIEFWQGRVSRLHDRLRYRRAESGAWVVERLAP